MAQNIITEYGALDTSALHNDRFVGVIPSGVYSGYKARPNIAAPNNIDLAVGPDGVSVLITAEGVKVEETQDVIGAVLIAPADPSLLRYDLIVAEYQRSSLPFSAQIYKVIKGRNQSDLNTEPVKPAAANSYQVPIAYVRVRPKSSYTGSYPAQVLVTDIYQIPPASLMPQDGSSDLKPVISPIDDRRIYVYPGVMTNSEGTRIIEFSGAHSAVITDPDLSEASSKYYLIGITDSKEITAISSATTKAGLPDLTNDVLPVCIVKGTKIGGSIRFSELMDVRVSVTRNLNAVDKNINYHALFANSIFKFMRIETFDDDSGIALTSAALETSGDDSFLEAEISGTDSSLTINWTGSSAFPTDNVVITTQDLMAGGNLGTIKHFMICIDTPADGIKFYYSGSSANGGFNANPILPNTIVRAPGQGIRKLYLKMLIPSAAFGAAKQVKINSFGALMQIAESNLNAISLNELGLFSFSQSITNLIANGDFYHWTKNKTDGSRLSLNSQNTESFKLNSDSPVTADGWVVTNFGFNTNGQTAQRIIRNNADFSTTTALMITAETGNTSAGSMVIEYRIPAGQEMVGKQITFAIGYMSSVASSVRAGVAQMRRGDNGLEVSFKTEGLGVATSGDILVNSSVISETTEQISFYVMLSYSDSATYRLYNARAAAGVYSKLDYNPVVEAKSVLRQYFERGRLFNATRSVSGGLIGASCQFGTAKASELGSLIARVADDSTSNRSTGVGEIIIDTNSDGIVVSSVSTTNGDITIDLDWEVFVKYEGSVS